MLENKVVAGIYISKYIASWTNAGGKIDWEFRAWLKSLSINGQHLTDGDIRRIYNLATEGRWELESSAKKFMQFNKEEKVKMLGTMQFRGDKI